MIVYTKDDVVKLSGALTKNQWPTIKAAARYLLKEHPEGIVIDGGELTTVTPEGARTFLDAVKDIEAAGARMVVCNLPSAAQEVVRRMPGLRSQVALSMSVEEARRSLRSDGECALGLPRKAVVVPVLAETDITTAVRLAAVLHRELNSPVGLLGLLAVSRELPLSAPLIEDEQVMQSALANASARARELGLPCAVHLERVRDVAEGLITLLSRAEAAAVVFALRQERSDDEGFLDLTDLLLRRAPCDVLIARKSRVHDASKSSTDAEGKSGNGGKPIV